MKKISLSTNSRFELSTIALISKKIFIKPRKNTCTKLTIISLCILSTWIYCLVSGDYLPRAQTGGRLGLPLGWRGVTFLILSPLAIPSFGWIAYLVSNILTPYQKEFFLENRRMFSLGAIIIGAILGMLLGDAHH